MEQAQINLSPGTKHVYEKHILYSCTMECIA